MTYNDIMWMCLPLVALIILLCTDRIKDLVGFYLEYRQGLAEAKAKYGSFGKINDTKVYKLIHLYKLLEKQIDCMTSWSKCPKCNVKTWQLPQGHFNWVETKDESYLCHCPKCDHVSQWVSGPGIMLLVDDGLDTNTQKKLANAFRQANEKTEV